MDVSSFNNGIFVFFRLKKIRQTSAKVFNLKQNLVFPESSSETHSNSLALTHGYSNINKPAVNFISRLFPLLYFLQGCGGPEQTNNDSLLKNEEFPSLGIVDEENPFLKNKKKTIYESADLIFHLLIMWNKLEIKIEDIAEELEKRKK